MEYMYIVEASRFLWQISQLAARLKEVTLESQQVDRLVNGASRLYDEKEISFERPLAVGLITLLISLTCWEPISVSSYFSFFFSSKFTLLAEPEKPWTTI